MFETQEPGNYCTEGELQFCCPAFWLIGVICEVLIKFVLISKT